MTKPSGGCAARGGEITALQSARAKSSQANSFLYARTREKEVVNMKENYYAYIRVSTKEQNGARQVIAMQEFGVRQKNIYMDKWSGKD